MADSLITTDYFWIDSPERNRFAQVSNEYLIEQLQFNGDETIYPGVTFENLSLNFNHPVQELIFITRYQARLEEEKKRKEKEEQERIFNTWKTNINIVNQDLRCLPPIGFHFAGGIEYLEAKDEFQSLQNNITR